MLDKIKAWLPDSKKARALIVGLLALVSSVAAGEITITTAIPLGIALVASYLLGQGIADSGKEAARVHAESLRAQIRELDPPKPNGDTRRLDRP